MLDDETVVWFAIRFQLWRQLVLSLPSVTRDVKTNLHGTRHFLNIYHTPSYSINIPPFMDLQWLFIMLTRFSHGLLILSWVRVIHSTH